MPLLSWLTGSVFYDLWQHGREIEPLIARKDERVLSRSTPELERHFDKTAVEQPRQNGFPVAFVMLLLLVAFALNLLTLLRLLPGLTPPLHALAFFAPALVVLATTISSMFMLARGFSAGLTGFAYLFSGLLLVTVAQLVINLLTGGGAAIPLLIALAALVGCRRLLNGEGFVVFALYCRTARLTRVARTLRLKSR